MGSENFQERTNGQTINSEWYNLIHRCLQGDVLPRNSSGVVTDIAGSLGSVTYRWLSGYFKNLKLVSDSSNTVTVTAPAALGAPYDLTLPSALPSVTKKVVVSSSGQMSFGGNSAKGADNTSTSVTTTSWTTVATLSNFACTGGRPVLITLISVGSTTLTEAGFIGISNADAFVKMRLIRDGVTEVGATRFGQSGGASGISIPGTVMFFDESPSAGNHTYTLEVAHEQSGDTFTAEYMTLLGTEW